MQNEALLLGLAEVSIAVTGFSGVVAALSRMEWGEIERFRFINLVTLSIFAVLFSFLPLIISLYGMSENYVWGISSLLLATSLFAFQFRQIIVVRGLASTPGLISNLTAVVIVGGSTIVIGLQIAGLVVPRMANAFYTSGILILIILAITQFIVFVVRTIISRT